MRASRKSNGEINRIGDEIRNVKGCIPEELLQSLQDYRISHIDSLTYIFRKICKVKYKVGKDTIVTFRIKRFESIIRKLDRFDKMKFSRMWDIGGCRCIVNTDEEVYKLKEEISRFVIVKKVRDYIESPKENGYKSLHLYVMLPDDKRVVEIQIRKKEDHNWATLVEISDLIFDSKLKEYEKDKDLLRFHKLLSDIENVTISDKMEIARISKKYNYLNKLGNIFTRNHIKVREQWVSFEANAKNKYFLIESSKSKVPEITAFDNFSEAEMSYFTAFSYDGSDSNIVLTHLPKPNYDQISLAYSNYILTMHSFINESINIYESLIIDSLRSSRYFVFYRYFEQYQNIILIRIGNSLEELIYLNDLYKKSNKNDSNRIKKKKSEWRKDVEKEFRDNGKRIKLFKKIYSEHLPKRGLKKVLYNRIIKYTFWKYRSKIKRMIKMKIKSDLILENFKSLEKVLNR